MVLGFTQTNDPLPLEVESKARMCLDVLVNHFEFGWLAKRRLNKGLKTLSFAHSTQGTNYNPSANCINFLDTSFDDYAVMFEETAHFIRRSVSNKEHISNMDVEEFFGHLGSYVGKELLAMQGISFDVEPFSSRIDSDVQFLKDLDLAYSDTLIRKNFSEDLLRIFSNLVSVAEHSNPVLIEFDSKQIKKSMVGLNIAYVGKISNSVDAYVSALESPITSFLDLLETYCSTAYSIDPAEDGSVPIGELKRKSAAFKKVYSFELKSRTDLAQSLDDELLILRDRYLNVIHHLKGFLAAETYVEENKDFLLKSKKLFGVKDNIITTYLSRSDFSKYDSALSDMKSREFKLRLDSL